MNDTTNNIPNTFPDELNDWEFEAIAKALRIDVTAARGKWWDMIGEINRAAVQRSHDAKEREAFEAWADRELPITADRQLARIGWMARAKIAHEYEARVEAEIDERTKNTSAEMDRVTAQRDRANQEVERLVALVNAKDDKLFETVRLASEHERAHAATVKKLEAELHFLRVQLDVLQPRKSGLRADPPEPEEVAEARRLFDTAGLVGVHEAADAFGIALPAVGVKAVSEAPPVIDIDLEKKADGVAESAGFGATRGTLNGPIRVAAQAPMNYRRHLTVLNEVAAERRRQHAKWGNQVWPMTPHLHPRLGPTDAQLERQSLTVASADIAKARCEHAFGEGIGTFAHILCEEVAEALDAPDLHAMYAELIQVAAVAVQMAEVLAAGGAPAPASEARTDV